ncbi:MAG TPA: hypothetical protein P5061_06105, partial [Mycobacterium sp.]|nr:hypothetical protein [Mycobacterium sp.]
MTGPVTRSSVARVGVATAVTAVCGYLVLYLAARDLEPAGFSIFGVFWGAFGLFTGAANGLLQQSTREIRLAGAGGASGSGASGSSGSSGVALRSAGTVGAPAGAVTHPMQVAAGVGLVSGLLIVGT